MRVLTGIRAGTAALLVALLAVALPLEVSHAHDSLDDGAAQTASCAICALAHVAGSPDETAAPAAGLDVGPERAAAGGTSRPRGVSLALRSGRAPPTDG